MKPRQFILYLVLFACSSMHGQSGHSPAYARNGMVTSSSTIASEVGLQILKDGGNAVDAAIATAFALAVTYPGAGNIGGGGFLVYHGSDGTVTAFDFREKAPLAATADMFLDDSGTIRDNSNHDGLLAVGVPGTVAGLALAYERLGSKSWSELVKPAVKLAAKGFPFTWDLQRAAESLRDDFSQYPSTMQVMYRENGEAYQPGETWRQPDLAKVLKRIQQQGPDGFYRGPTAQQLAAFMAANGGLITEADLAQYQAVERVPVHGTYRGYDIYTMAPPSSGGTALIEMLNMLEGYELASLGHNSARYLHLLTEAMRRAFADRAQHVGDPDFNPAMPIERLTSKEHATLLRSTIDRERASVSDSAHFNGLPEGEHTTHFSVVDAAGNAVSMTYTIEQWYGSKIVAEGLGFFLNNEMGDFNPIPGRTDTEGNIGTPPNLVAPGKRMLSSMTPTIVAQDGQPILLVGSPGGRTIINTVLQVILNVLDHGMEIGQAVEAGRISHTWLPDTTSMEKLAFSPDTHQIYEAMGHPVRLRDSQGCANAIYINYELQRLEGAADSRSRDGGVAGY